MSWRSVPELLSFTIIEKRELENRNSFKRKTIFEIMIFEIKPEKFNPKMEVVSCLIESNKQILLLLRQDCKNEGNKWGLPAGKVDQTDENTLAAIVREVKEETGIALLPLKVNYFKTFFVRYPMFDFKFMFFILFWSNKNKCS